MMKLPSLRTLMFALVAACLVPLAAMLAYILLAQADRNEQSARQQARTLALATAANVGTTLAGARQSLELLAQRPQIRAFDPARCDPVFLEHRSLFPQFANVLAIAPTGQAVCSALPFPGGVAPSFAQDEWFRRGAEKKAFSAGKPYMGPLSGRLVSVLAYPVFEGRRVLGYVALPLDLQKYVPNLAAAPLPAGTRIGILRGDGILIWRNEDPEHLIGTNIGDRELPHRLLATRDGNVDGRGLDGVYRFYGVAPVGESDLYVYMGIPADSAQQAGRRSLAGLAGLGGLVLLAISLLVWLVARRITEPVLALTTAARAIRQGASQDHVPGGGSREVAELADAFNAMVAEWQTAQAGLRQSAAEIEDLYQHAPCGYHSVDGEGRVLRMNDTELHWLGYRREEVIGHPMTEFLAPESHHAYRVALSQFIETGRVQDLAVDMLRKDGSTFPVLGNSSAVLDGEGRFLQSRSTLIDMTAQREAEARRSQIEQQLQQAQKMEAIGRLTGGIAHDFNNILGAILGFARIALQRHVAEPEGKLAHCLHRIVEAGTRAQALVAKMMTYSRTPQGETAASVAPGAVLKEVGTLLAATLPAGIALDTRIAPVPAIGVSAVDLHQLVMNLVINARDAIGEHGRIDVRLRRVAEDGTAPCALCRHPVAGDYVALEVTDTGSGIPPELQARIFDPFFTTKEIGKGTGLGLSVVQGILRKAGGHVLLHSVPGQGTTFCLLFPPVSEPANPSLLTTPGQVLAPAADKSVWVVDDEPVLAEWLEDVLQDAGYRVRCFNDPVRALEAFQTQPGSVDLLITDQTMPRLSGATLARALLEQRPDLPVLLHTGHSDYIDKESALRMGIRGFFHKPVVPDVLLAAVARELADVSQTVATD